MAKRTFRGTEYLVSRPTKDDVFAPEDMTEEQRHIGRVAEQFVREHVHPRQERIERHEFDVVVELFRECGRLGLLMIDAPEAYGGLDLDKVTSWHAAEKMGLAGSFSVSYSAHTGIATLPLVYYGTEAQKQRYLGRIVSGEWIAAYGLTEPDSGSDALGARTVATRSPDGKRWILNGTKQFITNGSIADVFTVFAKVDRELFTAFLVERTFPGVKIGAEERKLGIRGSSTTQVVLEDAQVPVENVLGEIGKGHKIAFNVLNVGRAKLGAAVTGAAKLAFEQGVAYANARRQFGRPIARFGAIQEKVADMVAGIYAAESVVYRLAGLVDDRLAALPRDAPDHYEAVQRGIEEYAAECAVAKVFCSDVLADVVDEVVQIHGGYGFIQEYPAERFYRDERINRIFEGTNEINRLLVSGSVLRRAAKGDFPLREEALRAAAAAAQRTAAKPEASGPFAEEQALLGRLKDVFLLAAGAAAERLREQVKDEQEVLLALADVAIEIFALESAVLRAARTHDRSGEARRALAAAAVKALAFEAAERIASAARKAAFFAAEGDALKLLLAAIPRLAAYDASGLLQAKRRLAEAALEAERYVLAP
jgi:alkylation response protein AidB-like acyl-CoA dehydrogenase